MILIDTSIWVAHLKQPGGHAGLIVALEHGLAIAHSFIEGELLLAGAPVAELLRKEPTEPLDVVGISRAGYQSPLFIYIDFRGPAGATLAMASVDEPRGPSARGVTAGPRYPALLAGVPVLDQAPHQEVRQFVERLGKPVRRIGWVDAHLVYSALINGCRLLTRDSWQRELFLRHRQF